MSFLGDSFGGILAFGGVRVCRLALGRASQWWPYFVVALRGGYGMYVLHSLSICVCVCARDISNCPHIVYIADLISSFIFLGWLFPILQYPNS